MSEAARYLPHYTVADYRLWEGDTNQKRTLYQENRVPWYLIADPLGPTASAQGAGRIRIRSRHRTRATLDLRQLSTGRGLRLAVALTTVSDSNQGPNTLFHADLSGVI